MSIKAHLACGTGYMGRLFFAILTLLSLRSAVGSEMALNLTGLYSYRAYQPGAGVIYSNQYTFKIYVNNCNWIIGLEQIKSSSESDAMDIGSVASCDGTNIYVWRMQNVEIDKKVYGKEFEAKKAQLPVALARIFSGTYPAPKEPVLQHVWLAFVSSGCLLNSSRGEMKPPFIVDAEIFDNPDYKAGYEWTDVGGSNKSRTLALTNDGTILLRDPATGKLLREKFSAPYNNGYTNGVGLWLAYTNVGRYSVPCKFDFTAFVPDAEHKNATASDIVKIMSYSCEVFTVAIKEMPAIPAQLPEGKILVSDRRFANRGFAAISYAVSNEWPEASDPRIQQLLQSPRKYTLEDEALSEMGILVDGSPKRVSTNVFRGAWIVKCLLILLAVVPLGVYFKRNSNLKKGVDCEK